MQQAKCNVSRLIVTYESNNLEIKKDRNDDAIFSAYYKINKFCKRKLLRHFRLRLICSISRASKFSVIKLIRIIILWVYYTISFGLSFFWHNGASLFNFLNHFVWLRITDKGAVPAFSLNIFYFFLNRNGIGLKFKNIINALSLQRYNIQNNHSQKWQA